MKGADITLSSANWENGFNMALYTVKQNNNNINILVLVLVLVNTGKGCLACIPDQHTVGTAQNGYIPIQK